MNADNLIGRRYIVKSLDWYNENRDERWNVQNEIDSVVVFTIHMKKFCGETLSSIESVNKHFNSIELKKRGVFQKLSL